MARYVDASNYLTAFIEQNYSVSGVNVNFGVILWAGGVNVVDEQVVKVNATMAIRNNWVEIRTVVFASGTWIAMLLDKDGVERYRLAGHHSALATGGSVATGRVGIIDDTFAMHANTRYFDNMYVGVPPLEPLAINQGRAVEFRHDVALRHSSDGLTRGVANPRGGRAFVPPAGPEGRTTRLWAKARRNNVDLAADSNIADSTKLDVQLRPRYRMPTHP